MTSKRPASHQIRRASETRGTTLDYGRNGDTERHGNEYSSSGKTHPRLTARAGGQ